MTLLGLDLLTLEITTEAAQTDEPGDCVTNPVGFVANAGDQRWKLAEVPEL